MAITSKEINLEQLDNELSSKGLSADFNDPDNKIITVADDSDVSEKQLEAAIKAHVAQPTQSQVIELNRQEGIEKLKELGFTDDQISALLKI